MLGIVGHNLTQPGAPADDFVFYLRALFELYRETCGYIFRGRHLSMPPDVLGGNGSFRTFGVQNSHHVITGDVNSKMAT